MRYAFMAVLFLLLPRFLGAAGNAAGLGGLYLPGLLFLLVLIHSGVASAKTRVSGSALSQFATGSLWLAQFMTLLSLGTLALGVAGFTFNEVFVRWFPNLGFSFGLLGVAGLLCLMGKEQLFTLLAILGVATLGAVGTVCVFAIPWPVSVPEVSFSPDPLKMALVGAPLLLGADLAMDRSGAGKATVVPVTSAMVLASIVLILLAWAGLVLLEPARFASLSVPHMAVARMSMGNEGRLLMGGAGILATLGGVTLLIRNATGIGDQSGMNKFARAVVGCLVVAAMLGLGFSGEELTETMLTVALSLWFGANALTCLAAMGDGHKGVGPLLGLVGSVAVGAAWLWGSWEHIEYAPYYLEEFLAAHGT